MKNSMQHLVESVEVSIPEMQSRGIYYALICAFLRAMQKVYAPDGREFYCSLHDLANELGIGYSTVRQYLPSELDGWKRRSGYVPDTLTKTTWWKCIEKEEK